MQTATSPDTVTLYYREGSSDKVYRVAIEPSGTGFVVRFAFGRRGATLQNGTKTQQPVTYEQAKRVHDQLVREKTAKGYTPGEDGTPYTHSAMEERVTGVLPQLLNPVEENQIEPLLVDDDWWLQEKFDGKRILIAKRGAETIGISRTGLTVDLAEPIVAAVQQIAAGSCLLDGEAVGDIYHCFDLLEQDGADLRARCYALRYETVMDLVDPVPSDQLRFADTATSTRQKRAVLQRLRREHKEGAVFKLRTAAHTPGCPANGGPQRKLKFYATASCIVAARSATRRSVSLEMLDRTARVAIGRVTIPPNHVVPAQGEVVEVRYLYAYPGGSLYQPVYLGRRDDVDIAGCSVSQLKFKAAEDVDET